MGDIPVIDLSEPDHDVAATLDAACRNDGFFVVVNHGVDPQLIGALDSVAREFFALPTEVKERVSMERGGAAWRGWFPLGGELTSGIADHKEGLYLGTFDDPNDPRPLHGANLFPDELPALERIVSSYLDAVIDLGLRIVGLLDLGLGVDGRLRDLVDDPLVLFRIFAYPPAASGPPERWGVGTHTDYGLLTVLLQDDTGGLEVHRDGEWIAVPPIQGSFVCNIGDMLERATGGRYRSTPHRARNTSDRLRLSFPLFLDPRWDARVAMLTEAQAAAVDRWDGVDPLLFEGTYGEYVLSKVSKVFPALGENYLK